MNTPRLSFRSSTSYNITRGLYILTYTKTHRLDGFNFSYRCRSEMQTRSKSDDNVCVYIDYNLLYVYYNHWFDLNGNFIGKRCFPMNTFFLFFSMFN